jgi:hypothetical protein
VRGRYAVVREAVILGRPVDVAALDRCAEAALLLLDVAVLEVSLRRAMERTGG